MASGPADPRAPTPAFPWPSPPRDGQGPAAPAPPAWAGAGARTLGRYRLGRRLGQGGMGEVFEAWDTLLDRRVALKTLTLTRPTDLLRFMREAQMQARVSHPNVCRIFDVDASGPVPVIAMQLVNGPNLHQAAPGLSVEELVEILAAVAQATNAAHRLNLIHRDLKPSNILLEPDGMGGWSTFVADFGLAKDLAADGLTESRSVMGTPEFLAPELKLEHGPSAGPASDIYALGATLRSVLLPAAGGTLPRRLRVIIGRCLEERPQDRYASAGELAEDLRRYRDGEPLLAERGAWRRGLRRFVRRHPTWTVSLGLTLLLGSGFLAWTSRLAARGQRQAALAQHFTLDARDLENRLRVERLIPAHDLRPAIAQLQRGLDRIREEMTRLGPIALGPGSLALGRGYCYLGDLRQARMVLNAAWQAGYRTPDVAYALARVSCFSYFRLLDRADMGDLEEPLEPALEAHLKDARGYAAQSQGQTWEPRGLAEARLAYLECDFQRSVDHARAAFHQNPWLYEAKMQEAFSLAALGRASQKRGDLDRAGRLYREASLAARLAQTFGQSDSACYLADMEWRFQWLKNPRLSHRERLAQLDEAERLSDRLMVLHPDAPRALCSKAFVLIRRAAILAGRGLDPEPELRRAERLLAPSAELPAFKRMVALKRRQIAELRRTGGLPSLADWPEVPLEPRAN